MKFNKILLLTSALLIVGINHPTLAMDDLHSENHPEMEAPLELHIAKREEAVQQSIAILDNNIQTLKTAYTLCFDTAKTLLRETDKPLSEELMEDAKRWMGSTVNYGYDHGWPDGIRENNKFLALHFLHATNIWLSKYEEIIGYKQFLEYFGDTVIDRFHNGLVGYLDGKKSQETPRPQTSMEIALFREYPNINYNTLEYDALSKILPLLKPFVVESTDTGSDSKNHKTREEKEADRIGKALKLKQSENEEILWKATY